MRANPKKATVGIKAAKKLGRSPITGLRVLQPVSKRENVSLEQVKRAVRALYAVACK